MEHTQAIPLDSASRSPRWWLAAAAALLFGFALVLLGYVARHANGHWFAAPPTVTIPATSFDRMRGVAAQRDGRLLIEATDVEQAAIVRATMPKFAAADYPRIQFNLRLPGPEQPPVALLWTTQETPTRTFSRQLTWVDDGVAPLELDPAMGWSGTIVAVGLAVRGRLLQPLVLESAVLPGVSAASAAAGLRHDWTERSPFRTSSIAFPFDEERYQPLSMPAATALAVGLAIAGYLLFARSRKRRLDARVPWAIFLAGWLLLDARWQVNLWRQLADTAGEFAGKSGHEKHMTAVDNELYALMQQVSAALPAAPARVVFLSDNVSLRARGGFFLYPHSVNSLYGTPGRPRVAVDPGTLHRGDHVLLMLYSGAQYDREGKTLVWRDGRKTAVDELLYTSGGVALLRVK
jgi:hypothetical protein